MRRVLAVSVGPVLLAAAGLTHPHQLSAATAMHWTVLHVVAIPLFPLLGMSVWVLLRRESGPLAWIGRTAAFLYACFYEALDAVDGVAAGITIRAHPEYDLGALFRLGDALGLLGAVSFLVAAIVTATLLIRRYGRAAVPGGLLMVLAAVSFLNSHIFWPRGVLTMLVLGVGLGALAAAASRASGPVS